MQRIRNKMLQKHYINTSVYFFNSKNNYIHKLNFGNLELFNFFCLVSYKYYLARRANNVL